MVRTYPLQDVSSRPKRSLNRCSIKLKNLENLPHSLSSEALTSTIGEKDCRLPPADHGPLASIASHRTTSKPMLPSVQCLISAFDHSSLSTLPDKQCASAIQQARASGWLPDTPSHLTAAFTELESVQPLPIPISLAARNRDEASHGWLTFSWIELRYECYLVSPRPPYSTNSQNNDLKVCTKKVLELLAETKTKSHEVSSKMSKEDIKKESKRKHALSEQLRRLRHKQNLVEYYEKCISDLALKEAGWQENLKAPTKETILIAVKIQCEMFRQLDMLREKECLLRPDEAAWRKLESFIRREEEIAQREEKLARKEAAIALKEEESLRREEELARKEEAVSRREKDCTEKDRIIDELRRLLEAACGQENLFSDVRQPANQPSSSHFQKHIPPNKAIEQGPNEEILACNRTRIRSTIAAMHCPCIDAEQGLPSLLESFHSTNSVHPKRKREDENEKAVLAGPSSHGLFEEPPSSSPHSSSSSRSSWYFV